MATMEGMVLYPSRDGMTNGLPSFTAAAAELVVPRSIPIIAPLIAALTGGAGAAAGAAAGAFGGGWVITGGGSFGSAGRVDALAGIAAGGGGALGGIASGGGGGGLLAGIASGGGGGGALAGIASGGGGGGFLAGIASGGGGPGREKGEGGGVIPLRVVMSGFRSERASAPAAAAARAGSTLKVGGGVPPSSAIIALATSSTPRSCRRIPASVTSQTIAAARKPGSPDARCASNRTSVSLGRGVRVRTKNWFCRSSSA